MSYKEWIMGVIDDATYKDEYRREEAEEKHLENLRRWAGEEDQEDDEQWETQTS